MASQESPPANYTSPSLVNPGGDTFNVNTEGGNAAAENTQENSNSQYVASQENPPSDYYNVNTVPGNSPEEQNTQQENAPADGNMQEKPVGDTFNVNTETPNDTNPAQKTPGRISSYSRKRRKKIKSSKISA